MLVTTRYHRRAGRTRHGFTLIEVLIAAGIFGVGLVAVAAIFPTAIQLQKQTFEEIRGDEFSKAVRTAVLRRGFDEQLLAIDAALAGLPTTPAEEPPTVFSAPQALRGNAALSAPGWSMTDRSGGSLETTFYTDGRGEFLGRPADPQTPAEFTSPPDPELAYEYAGRNFFWTPLFIDFNPRPTPASDATANRTWGAFIFVLKGDTNANYLRLTSGTNPSLLLAPNPSTATSVISYALPLDLDVPQDKTLAVLPSQVSTLLPPFPPATRDAALFIPVPGVVRLDVNVDGNNFEFINGVLGNMDANNPIVRVGDTVLAKNGVTYTVAELLPPNPPNTASSGIRVEGFVVDRDGDPIDELWAAHPGDSGESSLVRIIQVVDDPSLNNLVR